MRHEEDTGTVVTIISTKCAGIQAARASASPKGCYDGHMIEPLVEKNNCRIEDDVSVHNSITVVSQSNGLLGRDVLNSFLVTSLTTNQSKCNALFYPNQGRIQSAHSKARPVFYLCLAASARNYKAWRIKESMNPSRVAGGHHLSYRSRSKTGARGCARISSYMPIVRSPAIPIACPT